VKVFRNGTDVTASATVAAKVGTTTKVSYKPAELPRRWRSKSTS